MVVIPAEKHLSASAKEWATAELQDGAADDASPEERLDFVHDVLDRFEAVRTETAELRNFCSQMMSIHSLAHHTTGAGWNTVAQLYFRENWDRKQVQNQDGFVPLSSWDDKIAAAMRRCKQEKHLTKEGALLGPACPRIRLPSTSHHQRSASDCPARGGGGGPGRGTQGRRTRRPRRPERPRRQGEYGSSRSRSRPRPGSSGCCRGGGLTSERSDAPSSASLRRHGRAARPPWRAHLGAAHGPRA